MESFSTFAAGVAAGWGCCWLFFQSALAEKSTKSIAARVVRAAVSEDHKMVLCVRMDLKMGKGKVAAQCCHAAVACVQSASAEDVEPWEDMGCTKIALKAQDEAAIFAVAAAARKAGLNHYVVRDAGRTQIAAGSVTVCGIGPAPRSAIDAITGRSGTIPLKLL